THQLTKSEIARLLGASLAGVDKWERGDALPSPQHTRRISELLENGGATHKFASTIHSNTFPSRGSNRSVLRGQRNLFAPTPSVTLSNEPLAPVLSRLKKAKFFIGSERKIAEFMDEHRTAAPTPDSA